MESHWGPALGIPALIEDIMPTVELRLIKRVTGEHPRRLPVRVTTDSGERIYPANARIPGLYDVKPGEPRHRDAYFYLAGAVSLELTEGNVTFEVAGEFRYLPFRRVLPVAATTSVITLELETWPAGRRLTREECVTGRPVHKSYTSSLDGCLQSYGLFVPEEYDPQKPMPLQIWLHGHGGFVTAPAEESGRLPYGAPTGAIGVFPACRGNSHYQGMGEFEFFEVLAGISKAFHVDPDRIHLAGGSMGGAGTYHLAIRHPDHFASASPDAGYLDYRVFLWSAAQLDAEGRFFRDGGRGRIIRQLPADRLAYWRAMGERRVAEWERPLYERQSALFVIENTVNLPMVMSHGVYDVSIYGGVDVENSRRAWARLAELGYADKWYFELPDSGLNHGGPFEMADGNPKIKEPRRTYPGLPEARANVSTRVREPFPYHVVFKTNTLQFHRCYWVEIDALEQHWRDATVDVRRTSAASLHVVADNVRQITLYLPPELVGEATAVPVTVNGVELGPLPLTGDARLTLRRGGNTWQVPKQRWPDRPTKRPGLHGPLLHAFHTSHLLVVGMAGTHQETQANRHAAERLAAVLDETNGGWLCSLMPCRTHYEPMIVNEDEITPADRSERHLIVFGTQSTSRLLAAAAGYPLHHGPREVTVGPLLFRGEALELAGVAPNPSHPERYLAMVTPGFPSSAIGRLWIEPDYVATDGETIVARGFLDEEWQPDAGRVIRSE
jgi:pimeloyl-ACP methyl ester carboxylesterase